MSVVEAAPSATASQPQLPSVMSVHPLRRSASLSSADRTSAHRHWQSTLRERLGTPGEPPGRDQLPSLYDRPRPSVTSAMRPASCASRSVPPSTAGPSASIVAWFAQFRCESCGRIPLSLDAKFCSSCGHPLEIKLPSELQAQVAQAQATASGGASPLSRQSIGRVKPIQEEPSRTMVLPERHNSTNAREGDSRPRHRALCVIRKGTDRDGAEQQDLSGKAALLLARAGRSGKGARHPRPQGFNTKKESEVAVWLGNIKPRLPTTKE